MGPEGQLPTLLLSVRPLGTVAQTGQAVENRIQWAIRRLAVVHSHRLPLAVFPE